MPDKSSLAAKMRQQPKAPSSAPRKGSVSDHFKKPSEEYTKRLTLDLTPAQHRKLKLHAMNEETGMNQVLRDFIDGLPD